MKKFAGIDPGWTNLGFAVLDAEASVVVSGTVNPHRLGGINPTIKHLAAAGAFSDVERLAMERYVPYGGKQNPDSERILMLTGACIGVMEEDDLVIMTRAIDWKSFLVKHLARHYGFSNPSSASKLDKEFSVAAAEFITGEAPPTDHVADAICLAYFGSIISGNVVKPKSALDN